MSKVSKKTTYHHGDLRSTLVTTARDMIAGEGIESLSLRKLADRVGVSRTAPYHHFKDKNELICAIAEQGFTQWHEMAMRIFSQDDKTMRAKYKEFVFRYIDYATSNPELYDLMFGRAIWKQNLATDALKQAAYPSFQYQVKLTEQWQADGLMPQNLDTLRLAQVTWGTLHGIARLSIDGIYADNTHIEEMCDLAVELFIR